MRRRYCRCCGEQVSPPIPNVIGGGGNERFGLRLMLLVVSLKLLGTPYEKIGSLLKLLFDLDLTEAAMLHCVTAVAEAFGPRYEELKEELLREKSLHGDETRWRIKGKNHWLWAFLGKWSVIYEVDRSRGKDVPKKVLGDYRGIVISDSWGAWNHIGVRWQRCLVHYLRELEETVKYKSPGRDFVPFRKKLRRILRDAIRTADEEDRGERLGAKARLEARVDALVSSYSSSKEKNCVRLLKRLRRETGHALHVPGGGRGRLEQQRGREGAEAQRRHQEDHLREPVGRGGPCPRRADERQGDVRAEERELLRLRHGLPEQTYFRKVTLYHISIFRATSHISSGRPFLGCRQGRRNSRTSYDPQNPVGVCVDGSDIHLAKLLDRLPSGYLLNPAIDSFFHACGSPLSEGEGDYRRRFNFLNEKKVGYFSRQGFSFSRAGPGDYPEVFGWRDYSLFLFL